MVDDGDGMMARGPLVSSLNAAEVGAEVAA